MYIVKIYNDGVEIEIHGAKEKLASGKVVKGINSIDTFSFSLFPSNVAFDSLREFETLVTVYNTFKGRYEFHGRVLYSNPSMSESGLIEKNITCESFFGFLCDSWQSYVAEQSWTVKGLLKHLIDRHNEQVELYKRFVIGEVTVTDPNDKIYLGIQRKNTWDTLKEKLIDKLGGEFRLRVENGVNYIDYLVEIGETKTTEIALSHNMKSIAKEKDPSAYVTRLIPLGCKEVDKEGNETEERLGIESVNDGRAYIDDEEAIAEYGIHVGIVEWDDVTEPKNLLQKGEEWLAANNKVKIKYSITALDLSAIGLDIDDFDVCNRHRVKNALLDIDDVARIIKKTIDILEPVKSTIEIGESFKTLSDLQAEQENAVNQTLNNIPSNFVTVATYTIESTALKNTVNQNNDNALRLIANLRELIYPVGSIYLSTNSTNPADIFGGRWEQIKDKFLLAAGETYLAGATGGEANHTLTENELPYINGSASIRSYGTTAGVITSTSGVFSVETSDTTANGVALSTTDPGNVRNLKMSFGGGQAHNNMPPYLAVFIWRRVS